MAVTRDPRTGVGQNVSDDGFADVRAVSETSLEHASAAHGLGYSWSSGTYNVTAGDTVLLVKNTSDEDLHIEEIWLSTDTDTRVVIHRPTVVVTTPAGTAVTNVSLGTGPNDADLATAIRDETANAQGDIVWSGEVMAADAPYMVDFAGALIIPKNGSIGVDYVGGPAACDVTIMAHFD